MDGAGTRGGSRDVHRMIGDTGTTWTRGGADRRRRSSSDEAELGEMHGMGTGPHRGVAVGVAGRARRG